MVTLTVCGRRTSDVDGVHRDAGAKARGGRAVDEARELSDDSDVERLTLLAGSRADGGHAAACLAMIREGFAADTRDLTLGRQRDLSASWRAKCWIVMLTVADVGLFTVTVLTITPPPNVAVVTP